MFIPQNFTDIHSDFVLHVAHISIRPNYTDNLKAN